MSKRSPATRRGALSASIVTALVFVALVLEQILVALVGLVQAASFGMPVPPMIATAVLATVSVAGLTTIPLAIGIFVSLWQIAPMGPELRVAHVLSRSTLAAAIGAFFAFVVSSIADILELGLQNGLARFAEHVPFAVGGALLTAIRIFLVALPLVALGSVIFWVRLREVDRDFRVEGMLDL